MSPEILIALSGLITGVLAAIGAMVTSKRNANKDEITLLREEVERLHNSNKSLENEISSWRKKFDGAFDEICALKNEIIHLRSVLEKNGISLQEKTQK